MGFGIEARYLRCKQYWKRHLEYCKDFQRKSVASCKGGSVAVFGAGRLYDLNLDVLRENFNTIHFVDADPIAVSKWGEFERSLAATQKFNSQLVDITGSLSKWTAMLRSALEGGGVLEPKIVQLLDSLQLGDPPNLKVDVSISLNILSQLGIYWRERVEALWHSYCGGPDTDLPGPVEKALNRSIRRLEEQHLRMLSRNSASRIILLYDWVFLYYRNDQAVWQKEQALELEPEFNLPGFGLIHHDQWYWHIAPQGVEQHEYGIIHEVHARCYARVPVQNLQP